MDKIITLRLHETNQQAVNEAQKYLLSIPTKKLAITEFRTMSSVIRRVLNFYWQAIDLNVIDEIEAIVSNAQATSGKGICWMREQNTAREHYSYATNELPPQEGE